MSPEEIARQRAEREREAVALLESHPSFASVNVQIYEWLRDNQISKQLGSTAPGSTARMDVVLKALTARA